VTPAELLTDAFERIREGVHEVVTGLDADVLTHRPAPGANPVGWLVWHLTRVQDDHVSEVAGAGQAWTEEGWAERFGLGLEPGDTGYGHSDAQVQALRPVSAALLADYHDAVHARTVAFLAGLGEHDLDRVVDTAWDPPVTLGVRLVSVVNDCQQHVGQSAYVRGLLG
jgi:uncharacterized damage-inducible protein DinB